MTKLNFLRAIVLVQFLIAMWGVHVMNGLVQTVRDDTAIMVEAQAAVLASQVAVAQASAALAACTPRPDPVAPTVTIRFLR